MIFVKGKDLANSQIIPRSPCQSCGIDYNPKLAQNRFTSGNSWFCKKIKNVLS